MNFIRLRIIHVDGAEGKVHLLSELFNFFNNVFQSDVLSMYEVSQAVGGVGEL